MYVRVTVYPGVKNEEFTVLGENWLEVRVREPAERNLANIRVREIVAAQYGVTKAQVRLIAGHHSQRKILSITKED